jgi:hypothetical protein
VQRYAAAGKLDGRAAILVVVARPGACGLALRLRFRISGRPSRTLRVQMRVIRARSDTERSVEPVLHVPFCRSKPRSPVACCGPEATCS